MGYLNSLLKNIFRGTSEGDGTGTGARDAGKIINDNKDLIDGALEEINNASEKSVNKAQDLTNPNSTNYPSTQAVKNAVDAVQSTNQQYTTDQLANYQAKTEKGQANGYAGLDANGLVPTANLPAYVEEIIEGTYVNSTTFNDGVGSPVTPATNKLYVDTNDSKVYRWGGSVFTEIVASPGTTDEVPEGTVNKYFTESRVLATILAGYQTITGAAVSAADSLLTAIGKLQGQINTLTTSIGSKMEKGTYTGTGEDLFNLIETKETPLGAQSKADSAYNAAVDYANNLLKQGIAERYADIATMIADQANQEDKGIYLVVDASGDATVDSGYAYYEYKGTTVGDLTDYRKLNEEESQDVDHSVFALDAEVVKSLVAGTNISIDNTDPQNPIISATGGSSYTPPSDYNTVTELLNDQTNQVENEEYTVKDASGWSTITHSGWATFKKKATSTASESDYELREQQDFDSGGGGGGTSAIEGGAFTGEFNVSDSSHRFYDDYISGAVLNLSVSATKVLGSQARVRMKGDLIGTIPAAWYFSGDPINKNPAYLNELTLMYARTGDINLVNRAFYQESVGFEPEYQAFLDYGTANGYDLPTSVQQEKDNLKVKYLKQTGIWYELDAVRIYNAETYNPTSWATNIYRLNWKDPSKFTLNADAGKEPVWTEGSGFLGGVGKFGKTGFRPGLDAQHMKYDNASEIFSLFGMPTSFSSANYWLGGRSSIGGDTSILIGNNNTNSMLLRLHNSNANFSVLESDQNTHYHLLREGNFLKAYTGRGSEVSVTNVSGMQTSMTDFEQYECAYNTDGTETISPVNVGFKYHLQGAALRAKRLDVYDILNGTFEI